MQRCLHEPLAPRNLPALAALLLSCNAACGEPPSDPLRELERLVYVPASQSVIRPGQEAVVCALEHALLVARYEVTRAEWSAWLDTAEPAPDFLPFQQDWNAATADWPATGMTLAEARTFAQSRGMRLPTALEWMAVAAGPRAAIWPWAAGPQQSVANTLELGLQRLAAVGTFENGRSPLGLYDLCGNAWEWVEPPLPEIVEWGREMRLRASLDWRSLDLGGAFGMERLWLLVPRYPSFEPVARRQSVLSWSAMHEKPRRDDYWAMGGSYLCPSIPLHGRDSEGQLFFAAQGRLAQHRSSDVGLRLVADAEEYLLAQAVEWESPVHRERLLRIGASSAFGRAALPFLEELCSQANAPSALLWLLEGARQ